MADSTGRNFVAALAMLFGSLAAVSNAFAEPTSSYARVSKLYSTMDGEYQAIELELVSVNATPLVLTDRVLTVRDRAGNVLLAQTLSGKFDGPILQPNLLFATLVDDGFDGIAFAYADVLINPAVHHYSQETPRRDLGFVARIPIDGGTIEIDGMDAWTFGPLPLSGIEALARDGSVVPSVLHRYMKTPFSDPENYVTIADSALVSAVEYYHEGMDHYFVTALISEMELLDSGQVPGWERTGFWFGVLSRQPKTASEFVPVCRFLKEYPGGYSHILSSVPFECLMLSADKTGIFESGALFYVAAANPMTGNCPKQVWVDYPLEGEGFMATRSLNSSVYRFWNGNANANHRFVSTTAQRTEMSGRGWISEGYGSDGLAFCSLN